MGSEAELGETSRDGAEYHCPKCEHKFGFIEFPLLTESITDPRAPPSDRAFAEIALRGAGRAIPSSTEIAISGKRVYEDDDYVLLKAPWLLVITHPSLARYFVFLKSRRMAVRVLGSEKRFLLTLLGEMVKLGLSSREIKSSTVFRDFCQAVSTRGGAIWQLFFSHQKASDLARQYAA